MKPKEVLDRLSELGINVGDRTLRDWKNKGLIPQPKTGSYGQGLGRWADYPDETISECVAAYSLIHHKKFKMTYEMVAVIREQAKIIMQKGLDLKSLDCQFTKIWIEKYISVQQR